MIFFRFIYLFYYLKKFDKTKFGIFLNYVAAETGKSKILLLLDDVSSVYVYNISVIEYFQFRFFEKDKSERKKWAGSGFMYEYQLIMNPRSARNILDDKRLFYRNYHTFIRHQVADIEDLKKDPGLADSLLNNSSGKIALKVFNGKCGKQVLIRKIEEFRNMDLIDFMDNNGFDLAEEYIVQHPALMHLSPSAVNTIRIFTQLTASDTVEMLGCRLRISVNMPVDNLAAGNLAAPVDTLTGVITGPGIYSDITKPDEYVHPITGVNIIGFQIPFWKETIEMVTAAAKLHPQNRSIGWDIAITQEGPDLIEGNHDWCKLVYQLPVKKGLKQVLERHLNETIKRKKT